MCRQKAREHQKTPLTLTSIIRSHCSSLTSSDATPLLPTPALLTRIEAGLPRAASMSAISVIRAEEVTSPNSNSAG